MVHVAQIAVVGLIPTTWGVREVKHVLCQPIRLIPTTWGVLKVGALYVELAGLIPTTWGVQIRA